MAEVLIPRMPSRSMGLKLLLVCALVLLMSIPALFVFGILNERTRLADQVTNEISTLIGGPQSFLGPVLAVPYTLPGAVAVAPSRAPPPPPRYDTTTTTTSVEAAPARGNTGVYVIFPKVGKATAQVRTEVRRRGIFSAPVWTADLVLDSAFDLAKAGAQAPIGAVLDWSRAEFLVGASSARGAESNILLAVNGQTLSMTPGLTLGRSELYPAPMLEARGPGRMPFAGGLEFFGSPASGVAAPDRQFRAVSTLRYSGAQRIAVLAWAESTEFCAQGDWPDPSYDGGFLPRRKDVVCIAEDAARPAGEQRVARNFSAAWTVPYIARGAPAEGTSDVIARLGPTSMGVSFVEVANPYQAVQRSLKYAPLFVGLVFLAYFMFETAQKKRVHPAQYVLIGLAQIIFYLLLLSMAERIGFDIAFLIAASATVGLISAYAGWVFESRRQGTIALGSFTALYVLIYVLMRLEDLALLIGAVTSFLAIAAVMYFTRKLDWYGVTAPVGPPSLDAKKDA